MMSTEFTDLVHVLTLPAVPVHINGLHKFFTDADGSTRYNTLELPPVGMYRELFTRFGFGDPSKLPFGLVAGRVGKHLIYNFKIEIEKTLASYGNTSTEPYLRNISGRFAEAFENAPWYGWVEQQFLQNTDLKQERVGLTRKAESEDEGRNTAQSELIRREEIEYGAGQSYKLVQFVHQYLLALWKRANPQENGTPLTEIEPPERLIEKQSHKRQVLIAFYLLEKKLINIPPEFNNEVRYGILNALFGRGITLTNTKKFYGSVIKQEDPEKIKTISNLEAILPYFEKLDILELTNAVKEDIKKVRAKKT